MDISKKLQTEKFFDLVIWAAVVLGAAYVIDETLNRILSGVLLREWRMSISAIVALLFAATVVWGGERWPRWRDAFLSWRYPIAMLLAAYVGYQWHAHDYARSDEAKINEAARWACAKSSLCRKAAVDYFADKELE